ncbi:hypothetical protein SODALDRAFT_52526 [Sodiomyces alkalinus F11]|uniref:GPI anchored serine-threonine rich protein n=1 Tax=Sodiomyces alkalinus (strain CBS 110278 / VKM F-3762 / F11) TaxID=1314773 RepID=A0A3N2PMZ5_SODAK|nr:hypothetical protein SODALDRAFT_52526 [Sodiomyces alkalinus F11]ROT35849.1 hypothetical protein SODALDRAFT_52526 [Sodiomyces alkalinus F11]
MPLKSVVASSLAILPLITAFAALENRIYTRLPKCDDSLLTCGEYCISRDSICCTYDPPQRGYFVCPAGYECGPNTDCRPPSTGPAPSSSSTPACSEFLRACGSLCVPATDVCCENGLSSCPIGFVCTSSPPGCVEPDTEGDDDDVSSTHPTVTAALSSLPSPGGECLPMSTGTPDVVSYSGLLSGSDGNDNHSKMHTLDNPTFCIMPSDFSSSAFRLMSRQAANGDNIGNTVSDTSTSEAPAISSTVTQVLPGLNGSLTTITSVVVVSPTHSSSGLGTTPTSETTPSATATGQDKGRNLEVSLAALVGVMLIALLFG